MDRGHHGTIYRGQSNTIGVILAFAIVIAGATMIVTIGGAGLVDIQSQSEMERAENSMTLFDSRAAMVALGDSDVQSISLVQDSGSVQVDEDSGWIRITHKNYTGESDDHVETIYNSSLGKVVYENNDRLLAYQGGGVWQLDPRGEAQMISPPEFHYRGATLTLPIIRTFGDGLAGGSIDMTIRPREQARLIYPNRTAAADGDEIGAPYNTTTSPSFPARNYTNAIRNGTVNITVKSEFSHGWETYFEERTTGRTERLGENMVRLTLETTTGAPGEFEMPDPGIGVHAGSIAGGHPLTQFEISIDVAKNKPHFSFYAEENNKEFEVHVYSDVNNNPCPSPSGDVYISVYYYDGDGSNTYESWVSGPLDPNSESGLNWDCSSGDAKLDIDFLEPHTMYYDEIGKDNQAGSTLGSDFDDGTDGPSSGTSTDETLGNKYAFNEHLKDWPLRNPSTWDQHSDSVGYESTTYAPDSTETLDQVMNHYLSAIDSEVDLIAKNGPGNSDSIDHDNSAGTLLYETQAGSKFVTYLHVTENEIEVDLD